MGQITKYYCDLCGTNTSPGLLHSIVIIVDDLITDKIEICEKCAIKNNITLPDEDLQLSKNIWSKILKEGE